MVRSLHRSFRFVFHISNIPPVNLRVAKPPEGILVLDYVQYLEYGIGMLTVWVKYHGLRRIHKHTQASDTHTLCVGLVIELHRARVQQHLPQLDGGVVDVVDGFHGGV